MDEKPTKVVIRYGKIKKKMKIMHKEEFLM